MIKTTILRAIRVSADVTEVLRQVQEICHAAIDSKLSDNKLRCLAVELYEIFGDAAYMLALVREDCRQSAANQTEAKP